MSFYGYETPWAVEWSVVQRSFHVGTLENALDTNETQVEGSDTIPQWTIIRICRDEVEAKAWVKRNESRIRAIVGFGESG